MFKETKATLIDDIKDTIEIMNHKKFWKNKGMDRRTKEYPPIKDREGTKRLSDILARNKITTLYELSKKKLQEELIIIHRSVTRGA